MKAIAFGNRLSRDLGVDSFVESAADVRLEILDAINAGLQKLNTLSAHESRTTTGSLYLPAPATVSLGLTNGSTEVTGHTFTLEDFYRTIRIDGDEVDNQVISETELLHPYTGPTGTVSATIYSDAATVPEPYDEMVGDPRILETGRDLVRSSSPRAYQWTTLRRGVGEPSWYDFEPNARNQNPPAPSVIRFDTLPDRAYRLQAKFTLAPARISFADLLASGNDIPMREEHIESYLLPVCRGILTTSDHWKNADNKSAVRADAEAAEAKYEALIPRTLGTPRNFVRTKEGF